jgi:hypothetical protein
LSQIKSFALFLYDSAERHQCGCMGVAW